MVRHEDERAFPVTMEDGRGESMSNLGMTLRDYFAAKAANGLCANHSWLQETFNTVGGDEAINVVARASYELADAMLLERAK